MNSLSESIISLIPAERRGAILDMPDAAIAAILWAAAAPPPAPPAPSAASATSGAAGEAEVYAALRIYKTEDTAKAGKSGDFIVSIDGKRIMVEVKKYRAPVPGSEIKKFHADLASNASIGGGLFISLTSDITGMRGRAITYVQHNAAGRDIPIVFLTMAAAMEGARGPAAEALIQICVDLVSAAIHGREMHIGNRIARAVEDLNAKMDHLSAARRIVEETQIAFAKQFRRLDEHLMAAEIHMRGCIAAIHAEIFPAADNKIALPPGEAAPPPLPIAPPPVRAAPPPAAITRRAGATRDANASQKISAAVAEIEATGAQCTYKMLTDKGFAYTTVNEWWRRNRGDAVAAPVITRDANATQKISAAVAEIEATGTRCTYKMLTDRGFKLSTAKTWMRKRAAAEAAAAPGAK